MERLFYESRPFLFVILSVVGLRGDSVQPMLSGACAVLLLACSGLVLYWRYKARHIENSF